MEPPLQRGNVSNLLHTTVQVVQTVTHHGHVALARRHGQDGVSCGVDQRLACAEVLRWAVLLLDEPFQQAHIARASGTVNLEFYSKENNNIFNKIRWHGKKAKRK